MQQRKSMKLRTKPKMDLFQKVDPRFLSTNQLNMGNFLEFEMKPKIRRDLTLKAKMLIE